MKLLLLLFVLLSLSFISLSQTQQSFAVVSELCGNGTLDTGEVCDDGNLVNDDGCDISCMLEVWPPVWTWEASCGNRVIESPEQCDDGNDIDFDGCDPSCVLNLTIQFDNVESCEAWGFFNGVECEICPEWSVSETWATSCITCDSEFSVSNPTQSVCLVCGFGSKLSGGVCVLCEEPEREYCQQGRSDLNFVFVTPMLQYCHGGINESHTQCNACPEGSYDFWNSCGTCSDWSILMSNDIYLQCESCPAWTYQTDNQCLACAEWSFSSTWWTSCYACDPNSQWVNETQTACVSCDPWYYLSWGSQCLVCDEEHDEFCIWYCIQVYVPNLSGNINFCGWIDLSYPEGTYCFAWTYYNGTTCSLCPEWTSSDNGASSCYACPAWSYWEDRYCWLCPTWTVSENTWSLSCHACLSWTIPNSAQTGCIIPIPQWGSYRRITPWSILTGLAQQPNQIVNNYINTIKRKLKRMIRIPKL